MRIVEVPGHILPAGHDWMRIERPGKVPVFAVRIGSEVAKNARTFVHLMERIVA